MRANGNAGASRSKIGPMVMVKVFLALLMSLSAVSVFDASALSPRLKALTSIQYSAAAICAIHRHSPVPVRTKSLRLKGSILLEAFRIPGDDAILVHIFRHRKLRLFVTDARALRRTAIRWNADFMDNSAEWHANIDAIDFRHKYVYYSIPNHGGTYLFRASFGGGKNEGLGEPGMLCATFARNNANLLYRIFFPPYTDVDYPSAYVSEMRGDTMISSTPIGYQPHNACYCERTDTLYLVYLETMKTLTGKVIRLPHSHVVLPDGVMSGETSDIVRPIDVSPSGEYAFYANPIDHVMYKIRLNDGHISGTRRLTGHVDDLIISGSGRYIYLLNRGNSTIAKISVF